MNAEWNQYWSQNKAYGELLFKRAVGNLPEMESSKRIAKEVKKTVRNGDSILDVGCGAGHYLKSLRREIEVPFTYLGCDATPHYVDLAKQAFADDPSASFRVADVFALDLADASFDVVMCNNLFLHLPSIEKPLQELVRVARKTVIVRTLCGNRSFRVMDVAQQADGREFSSDGDPLEFYYYNIYSAAYVRHLLSTNSRVTSWTIEDDKDFDKRRIEESAKEHTNINASRMLGDYQVNGYILQPWSIVTMSVGQPD